MIGTNGTLRGDIESMMMNWLQEAFEMRTFARWFRLRFNGVDRAALDKVCGLIARAEIRWDDALNAFVMLTGQSSDTPSTSAGAPMRGWSRWKN